MYELMAQKSNYWIHLKTFMVMLGSGNYYIVTISMKIKKLPLGDANSKAFSSVLISTCPKKLRLAARKFEPELADQKTDDGDIKIKSGDAMCQIKMTNATTDNIDVADRKYNYNENSNFHHIIIKNHHLINYHLSIDDHLRYQRA